MPVELHLTVDQAKLSALQHRLKAAGAKDLQRELTKALKDAAKPLADAERRAALALPSAHGDGTLRRQLAAGVAVSVTKTDRNPGVRVRDRAKLAKATQARRGWRHPVYGHRSTWVTEILGPGWFTDTANRHRDDVVKKVREAVDRVARKIAKG